jgi:hypothetical protein
VLWVVMAEERLGLVDVAFIAEVILWADDEVSMGRVLIMSAAACPGDESTGKKVVTACMFVPEEIARTSWVFGAWVIGRVE